MIKKFKKVVISSILSAVVIFGAAMPMASAAVAPGRVTGYISDFFLNADRYSSTVSVGNIDADTTKVQLYDNSDTPIRDAVNTNPPVLPSPQVTSGQELSNVSFSDLAPGVYKVAEFVGSIKSQVKSITLDLKPLADVVSIIWDPITKATITVTDLAPHSNVSLVNDSNHGVVVSPAVLADGDGIAVFHNVDQSNTRFVVKEDYSAIGTTLSITSNYAYTVSEALPQLDIDTDSHGTVTVHNAVHNALLKLYLNPINSTSGNDTVTSNTYLTAIAPANGIVVFPNAITKSGYYAVYEIGSGLNAERSDEFIVHPSAPTITLSSDGTGVTVTGAEPNTYVEIYRNNSRCSYSGAYVDESGSATFNGLQTGIYTAKQTYNSNYSESSNKITVQKWMTHELQTGWNTLSVPFALKTATLAAILGDQITALDKALAYNNANNTWVQLDSTNQAQYLSKPMTALYLNILPTNDDVDATFIAADAINPPSVLQVFTGWNLVGPSFLNTGGSPSEFLVGNSTEVIPMLVSPNGQGFVYTGSNNENYVNNTLGYWIYAKSAASLIGQISTGTVSNNNNISSWLYNNYND